MLENGGKSRKSPGLANTARSLVQKTVAIMGVSLMALLGLSGPAMAGIGWGDDTGSGGEGGMPINEHWALVSTGGGETAYSKFVNSTVGKRLSPWASSQASFENKLLSVQGGSMDGKNIVEGCKASKHIWYKTANGYTNSVWFGKYWVPSPTKPGLPGNMGNAEADNIMRNVAKPMLDNSKYYSVVCSWYFENLKWDKQVDVEIKTAPNLEGAHSYIVSASNKVLANGAWEPVAPKVVKTEFGKVYDEYISQFGENTDGKPNRAKFEDFVKRATNTAGASKNVPENMTLELGENNTNAFANGGVVNYSLKRKDVKITGSSSIKKTVNFKGCSGERPAGNMTFSSEADFNNWVNKIKSGNKCSSANVSNGAENFKLKATPTAPKEIGFWQVLTAHCNKAGVDNVKNLLGDWENKDSGISTDFTGVVYTKNFNSVSDARSKMGGLLGENTGKFAETGARGFYDKECPYSCVPENPTPGGGSAKTSENPDLTLFRDNEDNAINVARWIPQSNSEVEFNPDSMKALSTTVVMDKDSTPGVTGKDRDGKDSGTFRLSGVRSDGTQTQIFGFNPTLNPNATPKTPKNWDTANSETLYSHTFSGQYTDFLARANWASENGYPVKLNFRWKYAPLVKTPYSPNGSGFNSTGGQTLGGKVSPSVATHGECYAHFPDKNGNMTQTDTKGLFAENTGSGKTNNMDTGILPNKSNQVTLTFVRSTTE